MHLKSSVVPIAIFGNLLFQMADIPIWITVNDESLAWLKFGEFGKIAHFAKLCSSKASFV